MYHTYRRIFARWDLSFRRSKPTPASSAAAMSHEFQVLAESGEDAIVSCDSCDYAANVEKSRSQRQAATRDAIRPRHRRRWKKFATPGKKSVADVAEFLKLSADKFIKTLVYKTDSGELVAALVRGDHEINELKLRTVLDCHEVTLADDDGGDCNGGVQASGRRSAYSCASWRI